MFFASLDNTFCSVFLKSKYRTTCKHCFDWGQYLLLILPKRRRRQTGFWSVGEPSLLMKFTNIILDQIIFNCQIKNVLSILKVKNNYWLLYTMLVKRNLIGKWNKRKKKPSTEDPGTWANFQIILPGWLRIFTAYIHWGYCKSTWLYQHYTQPDCMISAYTSYFRHPGLTFLHS